MRLTGSRWLFASLLALAALQVAAVALEQVPVDQRTGYPLQDLFEAVWLICR